jgi:ParB/RepB/Spo0J family partition protein
VVIKPIRTVKPIEWFREDGNIRHSLDAIQEMADSIKQQGILQALAALNDGRLIIGHRRLAGARLSKAVTELPVDIYEGISAAEILDLQIVENLQRDDLKPYEISVALKKRVEESGLDLKEIAARIGKGPSFMTRYLSNFKCIDAVQDAYRAGKIGPTDTETMAKATPEEQRRMLEDRLSGTATRDDIARQSKRKRNPDKVKVSRIQFPLPGGVTITITGHGLALDAAIEALVDGLKAMKKGQSDGLDAKTFMANMVCKAKGAE